MPAAIRIDLCSTAEVAPGNALQVDKAGLVLAVFNQNGELFVRASGPSAAGLVSGPRMSRG
jgi:hypothetical protein